MNFIGFILFMCMLMVLSGGQTEMFKKERKFWFSKKLDDTDNLKNGKQSHLVLHIDYGTGVHYIKAPFGRLIPRLDKNGNIVSEYQQEEIKKLEATK